jgi:hypothetical protein
VEQLKILWKPIQTRKPSIMRSTVQRVRFYLVASIMLAASGHEAVAQRAAPWVGVGLTTCGQYLEDRRGNADTSVYVHWTYGFLSAYNFFGREARISDPPFDATVRAYYDKYCRENPLHKVSQGTLSLIGELGGWKPDAKQQDKTK